MAKTSFAMLHSSIVDSSLWIMGSKDARLVFITMLAIKDKEGVVRMNRIGLAHRSNITPEECNAAIVELESPDPHSTTPDLEGRRIIPLSAGGWKIVNADKYRFSDDSLREHWREAKAKQKQNKEEAAIKAQDYGTEEPVGKGPF